MTSERAKMLYYEQLYKQEQYKLTKSDSKLSNAQGWIGILAGTNIASAGMLIWIIWAVM